MRTLFCAAVLCVAGAAARGLTVPVANGDQPDVDIFNLHWRDTEKIAQLEGHLQLLKERIEAELRKRLAQKDIAELIGTHARSATAAASCTDNDAYIATVFKVPGLTCAVVVSEAPQYCSALAAACPAACGQCPPLPVPIVCENNDWCPTMSCDVPAADCPKPACLPGRAGVPADLTVAHVCPERCGACESACRDNIWMLFPDGQISCADLAGAFGCGGDLGSHWGATNPELRGITASRVCPVTCRVCNEPPAPGPNTQDRACATPAPEDGGMNGDPFTVFNGKKTQFFLPLHRDVTLAVCDGVEVQGRAAPSTAPGDGSQWLTRLALRRSGEVLLTVETVDPAKLVAAEGAARAQAGSDALTTLNISVGAGSVGRAGVTVSVGGVNVTTGRDDEERIGLGWSESVAASVGGLRISARSMPAKKFAASADRVRNMHLDVDVRADLAGGRCAGILPQIWGAQPMSADTAKLLEPAAA